uniref:Uncharacterized protein n=1 Tax=Arundo donax TaxID=35708 RepID=A0A0A9EYB7_ARUDO
MEIGIDDCYIRVLSLLHKITRRQDTPLKAYLVDGMFKIKLRA